MTGSYDHMSIGIVSFSLDSQLILVPWEDDCSEPIFDIHDRTGQCLAQFQVPCLPWREFSLAHALGGRAAFACHYDFWVVELRTGQVLGNRAPCSVVLQEHTSPDSGLVTSNKSGSKLAFCTRGSSEIHLYDSLTLAALGSVSPFGGEALSHLFCAQARLCSIEFCGRGWALRAGQQPFMFPCFRRTESLLVSMTWPGSDRFKDTLWCEPQNAPYPVVSPSAAFVCTYEALRAVVSVHDTRSGQRTFTQAVRLPEGVPDVAADCKAVALGWSSCETRLHVRTSVRSYGTTQDYLFVVRF